MKFFIPRVFCLEWIKKMAVLLCVTVSPWFKNVSKKPSVYRLGNYAG